MKSENRNLKYYFLLAIFIFLLSLAAFFSNLFVVQSQTFYATANVTSGYVGFDVNSTDLIFGNVAKPGTSTRNIIFESGYSFPVLVLISVNGSIENILDFEESVRVGKGEIKKIPFTVVADVETEEGVYDGFVELKIRAGV